MMKKLITILFVLTISSMSIQGETFKLSNSYYIQADKSIHLNIEKDSSAFRYFVLKESANDSSIDVIDTIFTSNDIAKYDSTRCYGVFCDSISCHLMIFNFNPTYKIDTILTWDYRHTRYGSCHSLSYDIDLEDSLVVFYAGSDLNKENPILHRSIIGKIKSKSELDTLRIIPHTENPRFIYDKSTILFTNTFIKNRALDADINERISDSNVTKRVTEYDIVNDSVTLYNYDNWYDVFSPMRFSKNTNMYFYRHDTINKTHNIWMNDGLTESQVTNYDDIFTLRYTEFNFTEDSQLVYWIRDIVGNDTLSKKMTLKIE